MHFQRVIIAERTQLKIFYSTGKINYYLNLKIKIITYNINVRLFNNCILKSFTKN